MKRLYLKDVIQQVKCLTYHSNDILSPTVYREVSYTLAALLMWSTCYLLRYFTKYYYRILHCGQGLVLKQVNGTHERLKKSNRLREELF